MEIRNHPFTGTCLLHPIGREWECKAHTRHFAHPLCIQLNQTSKLETAFSHTVYHTFKLLLVPSGELSVMVSHNLPPNETTHLTHCAFHNHFQTLLEIQFPPRRAFWWGGGYNNSSPHISHSVIIGFFFHLHLLILCGWALHHLNVCDFTKRLNTSYEFLFMTSPLHHNRRYYS